MSVTASSQKKLQNLHINFAQDDLDCVAASFHADSFSGKSPIIGTYESAISSYFGATYALACCNGTVAIELALRAVGVGRGDWVALPPTAPIMTILPILTIGAIPVFVDIRQSDFGPDLGDLECLPEKPKALIVVPMWGYPLEMETVSAFCTRMKIALIEDCAHSFGTRVQGKYLGTFGDVSTFSTHERKLVSTGEGGFCLTNSDVVRDRMLSYMHHGLTVQEHSGAYVLGEHIGTNFKLPPMCAALGINQFKKLDVKIAARRKRVTQLRERLAEVGGISEFHRFEGEEINGYSTVWRVGEGSAQARAEALHDRGVVSDTVRYRYKPLYEELAFKKFARACPRAEATIREIFTLPCHEGLDDSDIDFIVSTVADVFG